MWCTTVSAGEWGEVMGCLLTPSQLFKTSLCCKSQDISDYAFQHAAGWCGSSQQVQFRTAPREATYTPESSQKPGAGCRNPWARGEAGGNGPGGKINLWALKDSPPSPPAAATHTLLAYCSVIACSQLKFLPHWNWCQALPSMSWCHQASGNLISPLHCRMNQKLHLWMAGVPLAPKAS